jgi:hypothetical protein
MRSVHGQETPDKSKEQVKIQKRLVEEKGGAATQEDGTGCEERDEEQEDRASFEARSEAAHADGAAAGIADRRESGADASARRRAASFVKVQGSRGSRFRVHHENREP